ncbi:PREDICTED: interferon alpha/beta receptor 2 isoform X1 [Chinchilla lanigera]|uniref:Interferon alpha/beta receptor 2 n=1 Tax=Chinchilla lanigera TaxID=34839 RepID=A0A8C2UYN4_CHILA|nr:PREDICTED: interferon alpha/beta receptor 2 isoform X1 [Chinchilla lanigera]XP_005375734.1 PREDICTED: interferon alpha/beta receptor 2 isoform X1 [Chinchilla lanigera]
MLWSHCAWAIRLLIWCLVVCVSLALDASPDIPGEHCNFKMTFGKYRSILSWELKNQSFEPTHYALQYTIMSKAEGLKIVEECTNVTKSSCDLTDVWQDVHETYVPLVKVFRGRTLMVQCTDSITATNMSIEPPDFEIVGFANHINVAVQFPLMAPKIFGEELHKQASLIIDEHSENIDKRHEPNINGSFSGNFSYVLNNLIPNTNYCVSVYFESKSSTTVIKPPLKCILLQAGQVSGTSESVKIVALAIIFISVAIGVILTLRQIGCVCLHTNFPKVLIFRNFITQRVPEVPLLEEVNTVEVISINRKKKVQDSNDDDDDDESDSEDEAPLRISGGGYTIHGLTGRLLSQMPTSSATSQASHLEDSANESSEEPEEETQPQPQPRPRPPAALGPSPGQRERTSEPCERTKGPLQDPCPGDSDSNSTGGSGDKITFNVNLNSVFLRVLHDDPEDSEEAMLVLPPPGDTVDLEEDPQETQSSLLVAGGEKLQVLFPSLPPECLWTGDDLSDKSDTSGSDADDDVRDGYIMR